MEAGAFSSSFDMASEGDELFVFGFLERTLALSEGRPRSDPSEWPPFSFVSSFVSS